MTRALIEAFGIDDDDQTADLLDALSQGARMDSMGLQSVVYWPHIRCEATDDVAEEEEEMDA